MSTTTRFGKLCKMTQTDLKVYLEGELKAYGYDVINEDGFLYAKGTIPILLTAHMDTVHKVTCRHYEVKYGTISSKDGIGGDDRCGIFMILEVIKHGYRPSVLFCEDEEIGGVGSRKFCETKYIDELSEMKYLIELDRMGSDDAVFYDCDNPEFTEYILSTIKYRKAMGSFSDISELSPACKVASVNLSCGYYNPHTTKEFVVIDEMLYTIGAVECLLQDADNVKQFEFIEVKYDFSKWNYNWAYADEDPEMNGIEVTFLKKNGKTDETFGYGETEAEAWLDFFMNNGNICFNDVIDYQKF